VTPQPRANDLRRQADPSENLAAMEIRVLPAGQSDLVTLHNLFQLYAYDFSDLLSLEVEETGRFKERDLELYFRQEGRFAYVIRAGNHLAGFAFVHAQSLLSGEPGIWDMAQFFVLRRHRRTGIGTTAAHLLFELHRGRWEIREERGNDAATAFWRKAIGASTAGEFTEELLDDERWHGPVQRFVSGP
jgi:predicted acetyltransferase